MDDGNLPTGYRRRTPKYALKESREELNKVCTDENMTDCTFKVAANLPRKRVPKVGVEEQTLETGAGVCGRQACEWGLLKIKKGE